MRVQFAVFYPHTEVNFRPCAALRRRLTTRSSASLGMPTRPRCSRPSRRRATWIPSASSARRYCRTATARRSTARGVRTNWRSGTPFASGLSRAKKLIGRRSWLMAWARRARPPTHSGPSARSAASLPRKYSPWLAAAAPTSATAASTRSQPDLARGDLVLEVIRIQRVEPAGGGLGLRIHEERDRATRGPGQRHVMREVERDPVHLP